MLREGARRYRALLALPGARRPVIASSLGSLPIGLFGLAILLLVEGSTGSFAAAGRVVGAFGLGNAFGAIAQVRLMDRLGQTGVLRTVAVAHLAACASLVVADSPSGSRSCEIATWLLRSPLARKPTTTRVDPSPQS